MEGFPRQYLAVPGGVGVSQDPEPGFEGSYGGKQTAAKGVISMLEVERWWRAGVRTANGWWISNYDLVDLGWFISSSLAGLFQQVWLVYFNKFGWSVSNFTTFCLGCPQMIPKIVPPKIVDGFAYRKIGSVWNGWEYTHHGTTPTCSTVCCGYIHHR